MTPGPGAAEPPGADAGDDDLLLCNLASGSKGNVTYVGRVGRGLLIDVGVSALQAQRRLTRRGIDPRSVRAVVITHEHGDHTRGARVFARRFGVPVYVHRDVLHRVDLAGVSDVRTFVEDAPFEVAGLQVEPFPIPHDTVEPVAFIVGDGRHRVGVATDMGMPTRLAVERLRACSAVVLEFNHDLRMLMEGPYPWWLKQRVRGRLGHLSNDDALEVLESIVDGEVRVALLGHLSQENNLPEMVEALALERLAARGRGDVRVAVLDQDDPGPLIRVGAADGVRPAARGPDGAQEELP